MGMKQGIFFRIKVLLCLLLCVAAGCSGIQSAAEPELVLDVFAVGKADAMLLTLGDVHVMIDTGENGDGQELCDALAERGVEKLELLILTHFDKDHIGGADKILQRVPVDEVRMPDYVVRTEEYEELTEALAAVETTVIRQSEDAQFSMGGAEFTIWASDVAYNGDNDNELSLVTKVSIGGKSYLFAGDAEEEWLNHLVFSLRNLTCDVLKVPHHGGKDDSTFALLTVTMPQYAIVTDSEKNPISGNTRTLLEDFEAETYRTAKGSIRLTQTGGVIRIGYTE